MRACVAACVREWVLRARVVFARVVVASLSSLAALARSRSRPAPSRGNARYTHRYISPRTVITWRINTSYSASTGSLSRPVDRLDPQVYSACSFSLSASLLPSLSLSLFHYLSFFVSPPAISPRLSFDLLQHHFAPPAKNTRSRASRFSNEILFQSGETDVCL